MNPDVPQPNPNLVQKVVKTFFLFLVFIFFIGIIFWQTQWFSNSLGNIFFWEKDTALFSGSLEASASSIIESNSALPPEKIKPSLPPVPDENSVMNAQEALSVRVIYGEAREEMLFQKNIQKKLPIASLTKLMTALVVLKNYNLSDHVAVSQAAMEQEGEQGELKLGQVLSVENLLRIALIESSNRAAYALSEVTGKDNFIAGMNLQAQSMGLDNTHFEDASGLEEKSYSTAQDLAVLTRHLFENYPLFKEIVGLKEYSLYLPDGTFHHKLLNTNQLLGWQNVVGGKTGWTPAAQGCFMVIWQGVESDGYVIHVILGAEDRFKEMAKLINWANTPH